jgi:hypothetical protein
MLSLNRNGQIILVHTNTSTAANYLLTLLQRLLSLALPTPTENCWLRREYNTSSIQTTYIPGNINATFFLEYAGEPHIFVL